MTEATNPPDPSGGVEELLQIIELSVGSLEQKAGNLALLGSRRDELNDLARRLGALSHAVADTPIAEAAESSTYPAEARVLSYLDSGAPGGIIHIGAIARYLQPETRLPRREYGQLIRFLNTLPGVVYEGGGRYRRIAELAVPAVTPVADAQPLTAEPVPAPDAPVERPASAEPVIEVETTGAAERELGLYQLVEDHILTKGYFSLQDLRANPAIAALLSSVELQQLGRRLPVLRKRVMARVTAAGGNAKWTETIVNGEKKIALAQYGTPLKPDDLLPLTPDDFMLQPAPAKRPRSPRQTALPDKPKPAEGRSSTPKRTEVVPLQPAPTIDTSTPPADEPKMTRRLQRPSFNVLRLLRPDSLPKKLSPVHEITVRQSVEEIFSRFASTDQVRRNELIQQAALSWSIPAEAAATILQTMYSRRIIGKSPDGQAFTLDASCRRLRPKRGTEDKSDIGQTAGDHVHPRLVERFGGKIIEVLVAELTHVQQRMRPDQIARVLSDRGVEISADQVKKTCRQLGSYVKVGQATATNRSPHSQSRGQKQLMVSIASQGVKDAFKRDPKGLIQAIVSSQNFDEYLAATQG